MPSGWPQMHCPMSPSVIHLLANPENRLRGSAPDSSSRPLRTLIEHGTAYSWPMNTVHTKWAESCRHNRRINNWGLSHSPEFSLMLDRKKLKLYCRSLRKVTPFPAPKNSKKMRKTRLGLSKRQQNPQRTQLPPAVPAKRQLPLDSRWRFCSVAKQPKQLLRTLIACVLLPALNLRLNFINEFQILTCFGLLTG